MSHKNLPSFKPLFLERMQKLLPIEKDFDNYMKIINQEPVNSIRCNTLKISPTELKRRLEKNNWKISQPFKDYPEIMIVEGKDVRSSNSLTDYNCSEPEQVQGSSLKNKLSDNKFKIDSPVKIKNYINNKKITASPSNFAREIKIINNEQGCEADSESILQPLSSGELGRSLEHQLGYYYIQEISSMLPIIALNPKPNETFLDLCSSPGSKTTQAAAKMKNTGTIIANEVSFGRIQILASNLQRCGVSNAIVTKKNGISLCKILKESNIQLDKILVDAPCSGEGTIRSSPKTLIMWNIKMIKSLSKLQKALLSSAIEILKPNGEIVYSTCTHAPEENEEVGDFVLNKFKGEIKLEKINLPKELKCREGIISWGSSEKNVVEDNKIDDSSIKFTNKFDKNINNKKISEQSEPNSGWVGEQIKFNPEIKKTVRIYPQDNNTEGFFIAKFRRIR